MRDVRFDNRGTFAEISREARKGARRTFTALVSRQEKRCRETLPHICFKANGVSISHSQRPTTGLRIFTPAPEVSTQAPVSYGFRHAIIARIPKAGRTVSSEV